jgi:hypothetical protein
VPNLGTSGRVSAFGDLNSPKALVLSALKNITQRYKTRGPVRGPVATESGLSPEREKRRDKFRHGIANALQLQVVFQPKKGWYSSKSSRQKRFRDNPVWYDAPPKAREKSQIFCELLNQLVDFGGGYPRIWSMLYRLSLLFWGLSIKDFRRIVRRIRVVLYDSVPRVGEVWFYNSQNLTWASTLTCKPWELYPRDNRCGNRTRGTKKVPRYVPPHRRNDPKRAAP